MFFYYREQNIILGYTSQTCPKSKKLERISNSFEEKSLKVGVENIKENDLFFIFGCIMKNVKI